MFTNGPIDELLRSALIQHANIGLTEPFAVTWQEPLELWIRDRTARLAMAPGTEAARLAGEANALLAFYEGELGQARAEVHVLAATGTRLGSAAGAAIEQWLRTHGVDARLRVLPSLNTRSTDDFHAGLGEFVELCRSEVSAHREAGFRVVFNLAGGFKSLQGHAMVLGMSFADEQLTLFEAPGSPLLRLPRLPVRIDAEPMLLEQIELVRRLDIGDDVRWSDLGEGFPTALVDRIDGLAILNVWGRSAWHCCQETAYSKCLLSPPVRSIRVEPAVFEAAAREHPRRRVTLNRRIDQLARFQLSARRENGRGLDVKKLATSQYGCTHECDAWHDGGAKRLFLRFEGETLVVARLGDHL